MRQREAPIRICKETSPEPEKAFLKKCHNYFHPYVATLEKISKLSKILNMQRDQSRTRKSISEKMS